MEFAGFRNLIGGLAHEINTPLGALSSNHDVLTRALERLQIILADEVVDQEELAEVRRIVRALNEIIRVNTMAVERVDSLVKHLRNFGRPDSAETSYADLHEGIDSTLAIIHHELHNRVQVVREYGTLPRVLCRPHQLNQVWLNLLVNACHAITGPGTITVRTSANGSEVTVAISDTGGGMSEEHRSRLFQPGFTTKDGRVGMGLGLIITQQIVEQHNGVLDIESKVGSGTTVTVTLPIESKTVSLQGSL
jgi:two-component system, NtrC family, sensor kinase